MRRWIAATVLAAGMLTAGAAAAGEYYLVAVEDDQMVMLDLATEVRSGDRLEIVTTWVYRYPQNGIQYEVEKIELDCARTRIRILKHTGHDSSGKAVETSDQSSWREMPPNSIGFDLIASACHVDKRRDEQTVDAEASELIEHFLKSPPKLPAPNV